MQYEALADSGGKQLRMLGKDLCEMPAEALQIGHARCVVLVTLERHICVLDTFFRLGWFGPHNTIHFGEVH